MTELRQARAVLVALFATLFVVPMLDRAAGQEGGLQDRLRFFPDCEADRKPGEIDTSRPILVKNPQQLKAESLPARRYHLGIYYKPCVVQLPNQELRLTARHKYPHYNESECEHPIFSSRDGGLTWSQFALVPDLIIGEPFVTVLSDGTMLMAGSHFRGEKTYRLRSEDGGRTWSKPESGGDHGFVTTFNVLELADGSLMIGRGGGGGRGFIWRSFDGGRNWTEKYPARFEGLPENLPALYMEWVWGETHLFQAKSGKIFAVLRVDEQKYPPISRSPHPTPEWVSLVGDESHRMILYGSTDLGKTWKLVSNEFGDYGQHYPSILRLKDGRLLLTFTARHPIPHETGLVGALAVLGVEDPDGIRFDFDHDVLILDARRPFCRQPFKKGDPWVWNPRGAAGFSPTVQLDDGTLVTAYSYRTGTSDDADQSRYEPLHTEIVRWRLPETDNSE